MRTSLVVVLLVGTSALTACGTVEGDVYAANREGGALRYAAREVWLVHDSPSLRTMLRNACGDREVAQDSLMHERSRLATARFAALDTATRVLANSRDEPRKLALLRRSEQFGDTFTSLVSKIHVYPVDLLGRSLASARTRSDLNGHYRFEGVRTGGYFVVPEPIDAVNAPTRWYHITVGLGTIHRDLADYDGIEACAPKLVASKG